MNKKKPPIKEKKVLKVLAVIGVLLALYGSLLVSWYNDNGFVCVSQRNFETVMWFGGVIFAFYIGTTYGEWMYVKKD